MAESRLLVLKTGSKIAALAEVPGDYEDWIRAGTGVAPGRTQVIRAEGEPLPGLEGVAAIIVTGSAAMVTERAPWMLAAEAWLRQALTADIPVLGICFGHQLLAQALGGWVDDNPAGVEVGTHAVRLTAAVAQDPLFSGLPPLFPAQLSHRQSVRALPAGARLLAASTLEPCQAVSYGDRAWGVQFHPEFDDAIIRHFIAHYRRRLAEEGKDADALLESCAPSPHSRALLGRFARLAGLIV